MPERNYKYNVKDHPERIYYAAASYVYVVPSNQNPFPESYYEKCGNPVYSVAEMSAFLAWGFDEDELSSIRIYVRCRQREDNDKEYDRFDSYSDYTIETIDGKYWAERYGPLPYPPKPIEQITESHIHYRLTGYSQDEAIGRRLIVWEDFEFLRLAVCKLGLYIGSGEMSDGKWCKKVPLEVIEAVLDCIGRFDAKRVRSQNSFDEFSIERITTPLSEYGTI